MSVLIRWCDRHGVAPQAVDDAIVEQIADFALENGRRGDRDEFLRQLRSYWGQAVGKVGGWPHTQITAGGKAVRVLVDTGASVVALT
ncbi:hypothetical protein JZU54_04060, partial [bacterium]|nr:hypothetical protein [bacterium]